MDLEKAKKELENIVFKVGQSAQTMHMLKKPQIFYDETHKTALGYQNPLYLSQARRKQPALYNGNVLIAKEHNPVSVCDSEETLILVKESRLKMLKNKFPPVTVSTETDDADESDMDLSNNNLDGEDDDDARYGVLMHNKLTATPNSTYFSPTVTSSSLDFIQTLLDETPTNELTDFMSHPVYTDAQTTSVEIFPDENAHHTPSLPTKKISYPTTTLQLSSLQAKEKKLMQKAKKNMRKFNFKKTVTQKFKEYDQKLEALINFNVSEAFEKVVKAKVLTEIKKLLPTHIPNAIANYVKPHLNTFMLEDVGEPSSRSSRRNRSPVVIVQDDTPVMQPLDKADTYIQKHSNPEWFLKKSGLAKKKTTWFDLLLKSDINKDENHILGPLTVAIAQKFKELIQKDELSIADLEGV
ncbi:hypothetical protein Tco_0217568 [Tanacetum coccineum]